MSFLHSIPLLLIVSSCATDPTPTLPPQFSQPAGSEYERVYAMATEDGDISGVVAMVDALTAKLTLAGIEPRRLSLNSARH